MFTANSKLPASADAESATVAIVTDRYVGSGCCVATSTKIMSYVTVNTDQDLSSANWTAIKKLILEADMLRALLAGEDSWEPVIAKGKTRMSELTAAAYNLQREFKALHAALLRRSQSATIVERLTGVQSLKSFILNRLNSALAERTYRLNMQLGAQNQAQDVYSKIAVKIDHTMPVTAVISQRAMVAA